MIDQKLFSKSEIDEINTILGGDSQERIFLVRGKFSFVDSGADAFIKKHFDVNKIDSYFDFNPNPQIADLKKGVEIFKKGEYKIIIAIGGGSVLDMAKLISVFAHQPGDIEDYVLNNKKISDTNTPLLAIPTTAGSGAEATHFSVLYIEKNKYSVACNSLLPNYVYITSEFSQNTNTYLTACTGMDALSQAIESVWSVNCNDESKKYALKAIKIIWNNLTQAVHQNDKNAKEQLATASYLAGKAINITKTTAPHAFSYAFTSYYNIPHGHAVALSLPFFLSYNASVSSMDCIDVRGIDNVKDRINEILNIMNVELNEVVPTFATFIEKLGLNIDIEELIPDFNPRILIENINIERLSNNPRKVTEKTIYEFLKGY
ncbi:MAG: phosphonoacetaldehyde reductase [Bacteroidota bacterium]